MRLEIVSPDGILFEGETESVSFPGSSRFIRYLPSSCPIDSSVEGGYDPVRTNGKKGEQAIKSGFVEVKDDTYPFASNKSIYDT